MGKKAITPEELRAHKARLLWRLAYAKMQIAAATDTISLYLQNGYDEKNPMHRPLSVAIVLRYAAPFISCDTLGRLEGKWSKFPDPKMQALHDNLIDGRNAFYAHIDPSRFKPLRLHIQRLNDSPPYRYQYSHSYEEKWLVSTNLPDIKALCDFQLTRIDEAIRPLQPQVVTMEEAHNELSIEGAAEMIVHIPYPTKRP